MDRQAAQEFLRFSGLVFLLGDASYRPKYDSFFFAEHLGFEEAETALDLTTGIGFHALVMAEQGLRVRGMDVNPAAIRLARLNARLNGLEDQTTFSVADVLAIDEAVGTYDAIVASPPQMPTPSDRKRPDWYGQANHGGPDGRELLDPILARIDALLSDDGEFRLLHPWYSGVEETVQRLRKAGFRTEVLAEAYFPPGSLSYERHDYLESIGRPFPKRDGGPAQRFVVIGARRGNP